MEKQCAVCSKTFTKPYTCSLKEWQTRRKFCSQACKKLSQVGKPTWSKGKTEQNDPRVARMAEGIRRGFQSGERSAWSKGLKGEKHPFFGRKLPLEHRENIGKAHRKERHWNWKGGITEQVHSLRRQLRYKLWKEQVFEKLGRKCQHCGTEENLHCHHIEGFRENAKLRYDVDNAMVLCRSCHTKEHHRNK
jgi:hypothetical protein